MRVEHLIFLIHPCCYEGVDPEALRKSNFRLFQEREEEVKPRWLATMARQDRGTLLVQLAGPPWVAQEARRLLGDASVCHVQTKYPGRDRLRQHYEDLVQCVRDHMATHDLAFDPATVSSELWGESFEGCVPCFGSAFAEGLGLSQPPTTDFAMTVYDTRFLRRARSVEVLTFPKSDIVAWIFECHDRTGAALFQARLSAQWFDKRPIRLRLDATRVQVCTKRSHTVWPAEPWEPHAPDELCPYVLTTSDCLWVRSIRMGFEDFREVVAAAAVPPHVAQRA